MTGGSNTPNEMMYRGEQYDSDLGLYYLRARYYNPITGRFMSRDPNDSALLSSDRRPGDPKDLHKYLYAGGDPVNSSDPSGRASSEEFGAFMARLVPFVQTVVYNSAAEIKILCHAIAATAEFYAGGFLDTADYWYEYWKCVNEFGAPNN